MKRTVRQITTFALAGVLAFSTLGYPASVNAQGAAAGESQETGAGTEEKKTISRFMDGFLPMPIVDPDGLTTDCWGAAEVGARDQMNGLEDSDMSDYCYWDGSIIKDEETGKYYMFASRWNQAGGHWGQDGIDGWQGSQAIYAVSDSPMGGFSYRGVLVSNGDVGFEGRAYRDALNYMGNDHGGLVCVKGQWYAFYHRHTNRSVYSRQTCAEAIEFRDGAFSQAELTSCGLNGGPLKGAGYYPAYIACNLVSAHGVCFSDRAGENDPCFTQDGGDREGGDPQYIAGLRKGAWAGFKYFDLTKTKAICVTARGALSRPSAEEIRLLSTMIFPPC